MAINNLKYSFNPNRKVFSMITGIKKMFTPSGLAKVSKNIDNEIKFTTSNRNI